MARIIKITDFGIYSEKIYHDGLKLNGDGTHDDSIIIQRAIKYCWDNNFGDTILEFEAGKTYLINKELCVYGDYRSRNNSHFTIQGNGCTLKRTANFPGQFGGVLHVYGLVPKLVYNPQYKYDKDGKSLDKEYNGPLKTATNITIDNLNIKFDLDVEFKHGDKNQGGLVNGFGVTHAEDILLSNCKCDGAPQTNFAVASVKNKHGYVLVIKNVVLDSCIGRNSRKHTFRLNAASGSTDFTATIKNCKAYDTKQANEGYGIVGEYVHLLCNKSDPDYLPKKFSYTLQNFDFDGTGCVAIKGDCNVIYD